MGRLNVLYLKTPTMTCAEMASESEAPGSQRRTDGTGELDFLTGLGGQLTRTMRASVSTLNRIRTTSLIQIIPAGANATLWIPRAMIRPPRDGGSPIVE